MSKITLIIITLTLILPVNIAFTAETLYPSGYNITSQFELSGTDISTGDTLVVTRTIINNESFALDGLYFSDNLPSEFTLTEYAIKLNGNNITTTYTANISPPIVPGYNTCEWVVDDPDGDPQNLVYPGDILTFEMKLVCFTAGDYQLPFHAAAFVGGNSGFFSTDDPISITVSSAQDTIPPSAINDLEAAGN
jgi:hypothetical protein